MSSVEENQIVRERVYALLAKLVIDQCDHKYLAVSGYDLVDFALQGLHRFRVSGSFDRLVNEYLEIGIKPIQAKAASIISFAYKDLARLSNDRAKALDEDQGPLKSPEEQLAARVDLRNAVQRLDAKDREFATLALLAMLDGKPDKEVSKSLRMPLSTFSSRKLRIFKRMRALLE